MRDPVDPAVLKGDGGRRKIKLGLAVQNRMGSICCNKPAIIICTRVNSLYYNQNFVKKLGRFGKSESG